MLLRAIRYCSTLETFLNERETIRMALLLNKYPTKFIDKQFNNLLHKYGVNELLTTYNYVLHREKVINSLIQEKGPIDYVTTMFIHFTYCTSMKTLPSKFHTLWQKYFSESPIQDIVPVFGIRNVNNLQRRLMNTK